MVCAPWFPRSFVSDSISSLCLIILLIAGILNASGFKAFISTSVPIEVSAINYLNLISLSFISYLLILRKSQCDYLFLSHAITPTLYTFCILSFATLFLTKFSQLGIDQATFGDSTFHVIFSSQIALTGFLLFSQGWIPTANSLGDLRKNWRECSKLVQGFRKNPEKFRREDMEALVDAAARVTTGAAAALNGKLPRAQRVDVACVRNVADQILGHTQGRIFSHQVTNLGRLLENDVS
jgi:hypothetical protein